MRADKAGRDPSALRWLQGPCQPASPRACEIFPVLPGDSAPKEGIRQEQVVTCMFSSFLTAHTISCQKGEGAPATCFQGRPGHRTGRRGCSARRTARDSASKDPSSGRNPLPAREGQRPEAEGPSGPRRRKKPAQPCLRVFRPSRRRGWARGSPQMESRAREQASVLSPLGASCKPCPARVTPGPLLLRKVLLQDHHERAPWCAASSCSLVTSRSLLPLGSPPLQAHPASTSRAVLLVEI